ncbi:condensation domain-containing protein [Curtobacterium sp. MCPF17_031]|uniref:condensation domain-containing protein n=1 Tax=Curtobacterium sp. MCPF17_031 TaxID=2175653 RepID=UPI0011B7E7D5|nr:condensation domain-containing protein [Curtobacterium sp. MCPF17_031]
MTAGQQDILRGTYPREFINRNAQCFAIDAPGLIDSTHLHRAISAMRENHPVLRMIPTGSGSEWRQSILSPSAAEGEYEFVLETVSNESLQDRMDALSHDMIERFDVFAKPSWGVIQLRAAEADHLVFIFNHFAADLLAVSQFVRSFVFALVRGEGTSLPGDTYLEFLDALEAKWSGPLSEEARWWIERPWKAIPALPGVYLADDEQAADGSDLVAFVPESSIRSQKLSEALIVEAVDRSVRDVTGVEVTRIDAARVGRNNHVERSASGWLSHAVPFVNTDGRSNADLALARETAPSWIAAFPVVRGRADLSNEKHFGAHVFLNFFGTFSPESWTFGGFRVSRKQPRYAPPGRVSLTPLSLKVRKSNENWVLNWSLSRRYQGADLLRAVSDRTRELLVSEN